MKAAEKKTSEKVFYTPENIGGARMSGKGMIKAEAVKVAAWVKERKTANKANQ